MIKRIAFYLAVTLSMGVMICVLIPVKQADACGVYVFVTPSPLTFGSVPIGDSVVLDVTIRPHCSGEQTVTRIWLSGADVSEFSFGANCNGLTIANDGTCTFSVTFTPASIGAKNALVWVETDMDSNAAIISAEGVER